MLKLKMMKVRRQGGQTILRKYGGNLQKLLQSALPGTVTKFETLIRIKN